VATPPAPLADALRERYTVERELGEGLDNRLMPGRNVRGVSSETLARPLLSEAPVHRLVRVLAVTVLLSAQVASAQSPDPAYLSSNPYLGQPIPLYDPRVSSYSSYGALNPYTTDGGRIYAQDGTYLGRLNSNPYDAESVANPYGQYGSPYSSESVNSPYGRYGSSYSDLSPTNPYSSTPPVVIYDKP